MSIPRPGTGQRTAIHGVALREQLCNKVTGAMRAGKTSRDVRFLRPAIRHADIGGGLSRHPGRGHSLRDSARSPNPNQSTYECGDRFLS